jgi:hypothetical protein
MPIAFSVYSLQARAKCRTNGFQRAKPTTKVGIITLFTQTAKDRLEGSNGDGAESSSRLQSVCIPKPDHTYCAPSETECNASSDQHAVDCASSAGPSVGLYADTQMTSTASARSRRAVRRTIWSTRERRLRKIIFRQRVTICRLRKKVAAQA